ncbi:hypothetical protein ACIHFC_30720 [Streptomyces sp. NPDC052013]|uniref:hypothetical protein n=1 Tax=Streptomyces sp. NPDC052013 TaxID=3365679 RepID=UPI0037D7FAB3
MIAAHDVQAQIEAGGVAGRGEHLTLVDVEHGRIHPCTGKALGRHIGEPPVGGRATPLQQSGVAEG